MHKINQLLLLFIGVIFSLPGFSSAQNETNLFPKPKFEHLTIADGLPESTIICLMQDHLGYMWFGTQNGLVRYDGYDMKVYQPDPDDSLSISDRTVYKIYEDKSNILWIGTYEGGLNRFDRSTETFTKFMHNPDDSTSINSNHVITICEENNGNILVGTNAGLNLFDKQTQNFSHVYYQESVYSGEVRDIIRDRLTEKIYVGSGNKIMIFDTDEKILKETDHSIGAKSDPGIITSFYQAVDGTIWICYSNGIARFNSLLNTIKVYQPDSLINDIVKKHIRLQNEHAGQLIEDNKGFLWIVGTWSYNYIGLVFFDPKQERFNRYEYNPGYEADPAYEGFHSLLKDRSGIIWAGTWGWGLKKWDVNKSKFNRFKPDPANFEAKNLPISPLLEDSEGIIWCASFDGLYSFNRHSNTFRNYKYDLSNNTNLVSDISIDSSGIIWVGTFAGLRKFDPARGFSQLYSFDTKDSNSLGSNMVTFVLAERNNILWVGTYNGLNKFDKTTGKFTRYEHDSKNPQSLSSNVIWVIYKDRAETLWIGTQTAGLNKFDATTETFKSFYFAEGVGETGIPQIYEDKKGNFWVGTFKNGLHLFDRNNENSVYSITKKDGLPNNHVEAISEDNSGNLWIATRYGLSRFDPETRSIKNYFTFDSFEGNNYLQNALKISTGEILLGTLDGFIMFHPDSIKDDPIPPQVVISKVSLFNRPGEKLTLDGFISEMDEVDLAYYENDLRFDYAGLHFSEPVKNQYKYMLENFDEDWVNAGTQRNATYTNLDAGEYIFRVTASNSDGVWNKEGASLKIIIPPPFWAEWWAYSIYVLLFGSVLYGIRKYELNRVNWKNQFKLDEVKLKEREETDKIKSRFFANISHEFRTPLTLILGPTEKILSKSDDEETQKQLSLVKRSANRLLGLINQLLDLSKLEAGKLELKASRSNIVPFIKGITMSFESIAERKDITLKVKSSTDNMEIYFDNEKMTKIMSNLLSNAFKFTQDGGQISVSINLPDLKSPPGRARPAQFAGGIKGVGHNDNNIIEICISDNGVGISEEELPKLFNIFYQVDSSQTREHEGTGIGLALTKELVELHHGTISVDSKLGQGTEFTIKLPLGRKHLLDEEVVDHLDSEQPEYVLPIQHEEGMNLVAESEESLEVETEDKTIILIVEDNADVREFIKDSLGDDFQIEEAVNGEQGVRKAEKIIPDLIISDVMMPKMDGNELTRILKTDEKTSHIPIILLTARSEQESRLEGLETGADDYLTKPFDAKELQVRINNLISIRRRLQERYSSGDYRPDKRKDGKKLSNRDEQFMNKVMEVIEKHISEEEFSIEQFGKEIGMSKVQIYRKLKALTSKSPSLYIRSVRLVRAKMMIEEKSGNISEIAYSVGFGSPSYFTRCFKEEYGYPPSDQAV